MSAHRNTGSQREALWRSLGCTGREIWGLVGALGGLRGHWEHKEGNLELLGGHWGHPGSTRKDWDDTEINRSDKGIWGFLGAVGMTERALETFWEH